MSTRTHITPRLHSSTLIHTHPHSSTLVSNSSFAEDVREQFKDGNLNLDEFAKSVESFKSQAAHFETIPSSAAVGSLLVDSRVYKQRLLPSPIQCLTVLQVRYSPSHVPHRHTHALD